LALMQSNNPAGGAKLPKTLFGYEVVDRIGEGAASTIYAVTDPKTHQLYALKHVVRKTEKDIRYVDQVENEFNVSKLFRHAGLRRSVELKVSRKVVFGPVAEAALVMEYVNGLPINEQRPEGVAAIVDTFTQTALALEALHHLKLVHCDLKPNNIIRDADGRVKVIDFGQTCPFGTEKPRVQGTPDYIAPEQVKLKPVSPRTDVYNFGATMYWTLTGERAPTLYTIPKGHKEILKEQKYPTPRDLRPEVPEKISVLVMDCLRYRPHERPTQMEDVLRVLEGYNPV
jgi:eukaryotic-like serine/threonine-protein kinase